MDTLTETRVARRKGAHAGRLALAVLTAALVACASSPEPRLYSIAPLGDESVAAAPPSGLALFVGPVTIPRYLERPQIVVREEGQRLVVDPFNRWGGSLETEILRTLGENLAARLGTDRVVVYPQRAPFPTPYRVRLDVERFEGEYDAPAGDRLTLKARWTIQPGGAGDALAVEVTHVTEPLDGRGTDELVRAHGAALATLSESIADRIRELERAP